MANFHLKSLRHAQKPGKVVSTLERIRSQTLNDAYADTIERINQQDHEDKSLTWRALSWIAHAKRQLNPRELCHILSLEPGIAFVSDEDIYDIKDVVSVCAGLVEIDHNIDAVRFIHYTTQEYFENQGWEIQTDTDVSIDRVTYLCLEPFRNGSCSDDKSF